MSVTLGIDIGGSSVTAVARRDDGEILDRYSVPARHRGGSQVMASALKAVEALTPDDAAAIGVGIPGQVDPSTGEVTMAVNLGIGSRPYSLGGPLEAEFGMPVVVENDVKAAAMGAYDGLLTGGRPPQSLTLVSIGTGISAAAVIDGGLIRGAHGMAGEIGHIVMDENGRHCRCGQRGCLETIAAGPAIARSWPSADRGTAATTLFAAVEAGDPAAEKVASRITGHLARALAWLAATYDTEFIVLAGGVSGAGAPFAHLVRQQIEHGARASELAARRLRPEQIHLADPDDPPGPRGAAALAAQQLLQQRVSPARTKASNGT